VEKDDDRKIKLIKNENCFEGYYDKVFTKDSKQEEVYEFIQNSVEDVLEGINSTVFTYIKIFII